MTVLDSTSSRTAPFSQSAVCVALICCFLAAGCSERSATQGEEGERFEVSGFVVEEPTDGSSLVIDHEEMPGYMPAMTMSFRVKRPEETSGLSAGDEIEFVYRVEGASSWIEDIRPTGNRRETTGADDSQTLSADDLVGQRLSGGGFVDENGVVTALSDFRDQVVALTFVFTRCPVPEYCPAMMQKFASTQAMLEADRPTETDWHLLTVSFDPMNDTPSVMKAYGEAYGYNPRHWSLLTSGAAEPVRDLGRKVGLKFAGSDNTFLHNLRTVVLDRQGIVTRVFTSEAWEPAELAIALMDANQPSG